MNVKNYYHLETGNEPPDDKITITDILLDNLQRVLQSDEELAEFNKVASKTGSSSSEKIIDAIRSVSRIDVNKQNNRSGINIVRLTIPTARLKSLLMDSFDNNVMSKAKRRSSVRGADLGFV